MGADAMVVRNIMLDNESGQRKDLDSGHVCG